MDPAIWTNLYQQQNLRIYWTHRFEEILTKKSFILMILRNRLNLSPTILLWVKIPKRRMDSFILCLVSYAQSIFICSFVELSHCATLTFFKSGNHYDITTLQFLVQSLRIKDGWWNLHRIS